MAMVANRYQSELERIKENIQNAYEYFKPNCDRFHRFRNFVFNSSLNDNDRKLLEALNKPQLEFNVLEAYVSRLRGEFSKQEPSIEVGSDEISPTNPQLINFLQGYLRHTVREANNNSFEYDVYTDLLSGGFSVIKVYNDYSNPMSFDQVLKIERVYDPTLAGFDPLARFSHKADGQFCFELYPRRKDEFLREFQNVDISKLDFSRNIEGFSWSYRNQNEDIILVAEYYEKKKKRVRIVELSNGKVLQSDQYKEYLETWNEKGHIEQPATIVRSRMTDIEVICRYRLIGSQVLDYVETKYSHFPLIFVDGNSILIRETPNSQVQQMTRPYVYNALGIQKLKNYAGQTLANELENMVMHKFKVPIEAIPEQEDYREAYTNVQQAMVLVYNQFLKDNPEIRLDPPQEVARVPTPPEVTGTFTLADQTTQTILGSYDAALGINDNQLSGVAIVEGATQSNAAAMPYVVGFMQALTQAAQVCVDMLPIIFKRPRSLPIRDIDGSKKSVKVNQQNGVALDYLPRSIPVKIEAGVNFSIQKSRALQQIIAMANASPLFAQFINTVGLEVILDNMEIRGIDQLKLLAKKFMQQVQQQQAAAAKQPNPLQMKTQLEQQKLQQNQQQMQLDAQLKSQENQNDAEANENEKLKILLEAEMAHQDDIVQMAKSQTERFAKSADLAMQAHDQTHRHHLERIKTAHEILTTPQPQETNSNGQET